MAESLSPNIWALCLTAKAFQSLLEELSTTTNQKRKYLWGLAFMAQLLLTFI
jgi:hypothetical protein